MSMHSRTALNPQPRKTNDVLGLLRREKVKPDASTYRETYPESIIFSSEPRRCTPPTYHWCRRHLGQLHAGIDSYPPTGFNTPCALLAGCTQFARTSVSGVPRKHQHAPLEQRWCCCVPHTCLHSLHMNPYNSNRARHSPR